MLLSNYRFGKLYTETKYVQLSVWCFQGRFQTCLEIPHSSEGTQIYCWHCCRPGREGRAGWDIGKELFPGRAGRPWHRVPRAAGAAPGSLAVPKARLDTGAGSSLGQWEVSLPMAGGGMG